MPAKRNKISLHDIFLGLQDEMTASLKAARKVIQHPGTKGDVSENSWTKLFCDYLPSRYSARRAIVVDCEGNTSDAIDVVVFDRHFSPFLLNKDGVAYIPAESVYATFEVKQDFDGATIRYAGEKAASVRGLKRTSTTIVHAGGKHRPVKPKHIICGLLALGSTWKTSDTKGVRKCLLSLRPEERLDVGCSLDWGSFSSEIGPKKGHHVEFFSREVALVSFFLSLVDALQKTGSVPAMDIRAYRRNL